MSVEVSFCIASLNKRNLLIRCLNSIFEQEQPFAYEVIVVDSHSDDGSAGAVKEQFGERIRLIELPDRPGKAAVDNLLLENARGEFGLLLNDDSELRPRAAAKLLEALRGSPNAGAAGAKLLSPDGVAQPSAWRFPSVSTALISALTLGRAGVVHSSGETTREVDWCQSAALMVRVRTNQEIGGLDSAFFVYSDEVDWCKRAADAGWRTLYVPAAEVVHHEQLGGNDLPRERITEFCRNRDYFIRKHYGPARALIVRLLTAWQYLVRAAAAAVIPRHSPKRYLFHVRRTLWPKKGRGLRDLAADYNSKLS